MKFASSLISRPPFDFPLPVPTLIPAPFRLYQDHLLLTASLLYLGLHDTSQNPCLTVLGPPLASLLPRLGF
jgi:hypothetical protein